MLSTQRVLLSLVLLGALFLALQFNASGAAALSAAALAPSPVPIARDIVAQDEPSHGDDTGRLALAATVSALTVVLVVATFVSARRRRPR